MATYILYKLTDQGVNNIKDAPKRIDAVGKGAEAMGGKITSVYITFGEV